MSERPVLSVTAANGDLSVTDETVVHNADGSTTYSVAWFEFPDVEECASRSSTPASPFGV